MSQSLWSLNVGESGTIEKINFSFAHMNNRIKALGFSVGEYVVCVNKAPFGDVKSFEVSNSIFGLDKDVAENIIISMEL